MPLLLFNFLFDTALTLVRRWRRGENLAAAHREHLYQLFHRMGYSHRTVALSHYAMCLLQALCTAWLLEMEGEARLIAFLPALLLQLLYARWVLRGAKRHRLI